MSQNSQFDQILEDMISAWSFDGVPLGDKQLIFSASKAKRPEPVLIDFLERCILNYKEELLTKPILCEAKIIEQPTWGGTSILEKKGLIDKASWKGKRVGQAYENHAYLPVKTDDGWIFTILDVSLVLGEEFLGSVAFKAVPAMGQLRKDTEAFGNSFQMHLDHPELIKRDGEDQLLIPKGEAMRYLDRPGLLTCGVKCKGDEDWKDYETRLRTIESEMQKLSKRILSREIDLNVAKEEAVKLVSDHNPYVWTNLLRPEPGDVVDFSVPGRHHSWEEVNEITRKLFREAGFKDQLYDDFKVNRLDEIQTGLYVDLEGRYTETSSVSIDEFKTLSLCEKRKCVVVLTDDNSSIRAFDKGKFRTDGALRPLDIDSYFKFISRENDLNLSNAVVKPQVSDLSDGTVSKYIFATDKYAFTVIDTSKQNDESVFEKSFSGEFCDTSDSYHHIYVDAGPVILTFERGHDPITVNEGYSVFLSSTFGRYGINPTGSCKNARISISYVPGST